MKTQYISTVCAFVLLIYSATIFSQTTNPAVGATSGQLAVNQSGGAAYTIPVECPPGINGLKPNISLMYNSQSGNGIAGIGWTIGGLSMISRVSKDIYHNDAIAPFDWTKNSPFTLDGNRLIPATTYMDSIVYYLEIDNFSKIVGYNITAYGPTYFKVYHKNGQVWQYGNNSANKFANYYLTTDGSKRLGWLLTKIIDTNGNDINFYYTGEISGTNVINHRINTIDYAHGNYIYQTVYFGYENRDDIIQTYIAGVLSRQEKRLKSIRTRSVTICPECSYRKYTLEYALSSGTNNKSNLTRIIESSGVTEINSSDVQQLKSTDVSWVNNENSIHTRTTLLPDINANADVRDKNWFAVDANGDAFTDIVSVYTNADKTFFDIYKNNGGVSFNRESYQTGYVTNWSNIIAGPVGSAYFRNKSLPFVYVPVFFSNNSLSFLNITNVNDNADVSLETPVPTTSTNDYPVYACGDLNSDGFDDFIVAEKKANSNGKMVVHILWGNAFGSVLSKYYWDMPWRPEKIIISDFNKDGLNDVCILSQLRCVIMGNDGGTKDVTGIVKLSFSEKGRITNLTLGNIFKPQIGDFNGDGLPDFIMTNPWRIAINNGNSGFNISDLTSIDVSFGENEDSKKHDQCIVMDFDNDGKSDIVVIDYKYDTNNQFDGSNVIWYKSTGSNFTEHNRFSWSVNAYSFINLNMLGDFNGDGKADLTSYKYNFYTPQTIPALLETGYGYHYFYTSASPYADGTVKTITDGLGNKLELEYAPISDNSVYTHTVGASGSSNAVKEMTAVMRVLKKSKFSTGTTKRNETTYKYENGLLHLQGKGFLGFLTTEITEANSQMKSISKNQINTSRMLLYPLSITQQTISGTLTQKITPTYEFRQRYGQSYYILCTREMVDDVLKGININTIYDTFDVYGNPKYITTTYGNEVIEKKTVSYVKKGAWCNNLPNSVTYTRTANGGTYTRKTDYEYYANGNLHKEMSDPNDTNKMEKEYTYDNRGNILIAKRTANNIIRQSSYTYSNGGYTPASYTDELGITTTYSYNTGTGLITSKTDQTGRTQYEYDKFCRLKKITYPNGVITNITLSWNNAINGSVFVKETATSGQPTQWTYYNSLGEETSSAKMNFDNKIYHTTIGRNNLGKIISVSTPYVRTGSYSYYAKENFTYDAYGRIVEYKTYHTANRTPIITAYTYNGLETTVTSPVETVKTKYDAAGQKEYVQTNDKKVSYEYYPSGLLKKTTPQSGTAITLEYDLQGNRTKITDPDAGIITSRYNGFGELKETNQAVHNAVQQITTTYSHNSNGLISSKNLNGQVSIYFYDSQKRLISEIIMTRTGQTQHSITYTYDSYNRPTTTTETIDGKTYSSTVGYDTYGRPYKKTYPGGYYITYQYDDNGILKSATNQSGTIIWQVQTTNGYGITSEKVGSLTHNIDYNAWDGMLMSDFCGSLFNFTYNYGTDGKRNMQSKRNNLTGQTEKYIYDSFNRLLEWNTYNSSNTLLKENKITYGTYFYGGYYHTPGNKITAFITAGYDINYGEYGFPKNAPTSITANVDAVPRFTQDIAYTDFKKAASIEDDSNKIVITYGVDEQRRKMQMYENDVLKQTKYYFGNYEEEIDETSGNIRKIHYLSGGNGLCAVWVDNSAATDSLYYAFTDYQGNLTALADASGTLLRQYAYDPWGNRRNAADWTQEDTGNLYFSRGYTMHEHLDQFKLINMNGRVYDPILGCFFSPDPFVQAPGNWLNYNRYSYCLNNPLKYVDPSGQAWKGWKWLGLGVADVFTGGAVSATVGLTAVSAITGVGLTAAEIPITAVVGGTSALTTAGVTGASAIATIGMAAGTASSIDHAVTFVGSFHNGPQWGGRRFDNHLKMFGGLFQTDPNKNFWQNTGSLLSRWIWESPQTITGLGYSYFRNMIGQVDRVDYLGGATFITNENAGYRDGITLANYININIFDRITGSFQDRVLSDPLFMHEYGHTIDSRTFGLSYLLAIGLPSLLSANKSTQIPNEPRNVTTHDKYWTEMRANRNAQKYFGKYYGVDWNSPFDGYTIETFYPTIWRW